MIFYGESFSPISFDEIFPSSRSHQRTPSDGANSSPASPTFPAETTFRGKKNGPGQGKPVLLLRAMLFSEKANLRQMFHQMQLYSTYELFSGIVLRLEDCTDLVPDHHGKEKDLRRTYFGRLIDLDALADPSYDSLDEIRFAVHGDRRCAVFVSRQPYSESRVEEEISLAVERFLLGAEEEDRRRRPSFAVSMELGNELWDPYVSHLTWADARFIVDDASRSDQMVKSYLLPKIEPMFERPEGPEAGLVCFSCCFLMMLRAYVVIFDWLRAYLVPRLFGFFPYLGTGSGRLVFRYQRWVISAVKFVHPTVLDSKKSEWNYKNEFCHLSGGSFYTYNFDVSFFSKEHPDLQKANLGPSNLFVHHWESLKRSVISSPSNPFTYFALFLFFLATFTITPPGFVDYLSANVGIVAQKNFKLWSTFLQLLRTWLTFPLWTFVIALALRRNFAFLDPVYYHNTLFKVFLVWPRKFAVSDEWRKKYGRYMRKGDGWKRFSDWTYTILFAGTFAMIGFLFPLVYVGGKTAQLAAYMLANSRHVSSFGIKHVGDDDVDDGETDNKDVVPDDASCGEENNDEKKKNENKKKTDCSGNGDDDNGRSRSSMNLKTA